MSRPLLVLLLAAAAALGWWYKRGRAPAMEELSNGDFGISMSREELASLPPEQRAALEAAVREATSPEDFERRVREAAATGGTQAALAAPGVPQGRRFALEDFDERYLKASLQGWRVRVARDLVARSEPTAMAALGAIDAQLASIAGALPAERVASLRLVPIWLEDKVPGMEVLVYHWTDGWLREHGLNTAKADSIDIPDAQAFLMNVGDQPGMLLHELTHAYHMRALGEQNEEIARAYRGAMAAGLYERVRSVSGGEGPAYARTNEKEYFAEITEAYFLRNDFYPFTRAELRAYDPGGYALVEALWLRR